MAPEPHQAIGPFTEADRLLVRHRVLIECARAGATTISEIDVAGRTVPLPHLLDALLGGPPVGNEITDQAKLWAAWCRSHGEDGLAHVLRDLADVRERARAGDSVDAPMQKLWRFIQTRNRGEVNDMQGSIEALVKARTANA